jgi:hypothetical protein
MFVNSGAKNKPHLVYTVINNGYDKLLDPLWTPPNVHYVAFTDQIPPVRESTAWQVRMMPPSIGEGKLQNRYLKMLYGVGLTEFASVTYIDGHIKVIGSLESRISQVLCSGAAFGVFRHPSRSTLREELAAVVLQGRSSPQEAEFDRAKIDSLGDSDSLGLFVGGVIVKNPSASSLRPAMESWWGHFYKNPSRDQLSLPLVVSDFRQDIICWKHWEFDFDSQFLTVPHSRSRTVEERIKRFLYSKFPIFFAQVRRAVRGNGP